jgi:hypothetical protein
MFLVPKIRDKDFLHRVSFPLDIGPRPELVIMNLDSFLRLWKGVREHQRLSFLETLDFIITLHPKHKRDAAKALQGVFEGASVPWWHLVD